MIVWKLGVLILCLGSSIAQTSFPAPSPHLSPQQQGHILSDIQQHQHRFRVHQQQQTPNQPIVRQQQPVQQHHTQTGFTPVTSQSEDVLSPEQNFQLQKYFEEQRQQQRLKELREKQKIIEKHQQFVEKQYEKALKKAQSEHEDFLKAQQQSRQKLVEAYYQTEEPPQAVTRNSPRTIAPHESNVFQAALQQYWKEHPTTTTTTTTTSTTTTTQRPTKKPLSIHQPIDVSELKRAPKTVVLPTPKTLDQLELSQEDILKHLKESLAQNPLEDSNKNYSAREISLPNGQRIEVIRTSDPNLISGATALSPDGSNLINRISSPPSTIAPPKKILDDLTKNILPPGADFELIKHTQNGIEKVNGKSITGQKAVTFVLLEEQQDGSYKVQGVKGNGAKDKEVDVQSILKKIKDGEIQLPPTSTIKPQTTKYPLRPTREPSYTNYVKSQNPNQPSPKPTIITSSDSILQKYHTPDERTYESNLHSHPTAVPSETIISSTLATPLHSKKPHYDSIFASTSASISETTRNELSHSTTPAQSSAATGLIDILKKQGLYAMAKFLKQSALDTILNETGPYTIFVPTDKAFRTLLVQLGGPEKAEEKFRENPRLLSGLLLHHVIPGAFEITSLQDEMTGVSLAGTQLRVNQYNMHDIEWNEVKATTINGAKVLSDKQDIQIPQGVAHAIDRVMFPLPVGDIVQTLQSDRERKFTMFLRALFNSGLAETLQGAKTFTLFAPTDSAFEDLPSEDLTRLVTDKELAKELVMRHIVPGTLFTSGMRYYQVRQTLDNLKQLTLNKNSGRVKVNNQSIVTQNIPATNGVIHAINTLL